MRILSQSAALAAPLGLAGFCLAKCLAQTPDICGAAPHFTAHVAADPVGAAISAALACALLQIPRHFAAPFPKIINC